MLKSIALREAHGGQILPVDMRDPTLALYMPLWYPHGDMTGSTIYSYDKNAHSCPVTGATWGSDGRIFAGGDDLINVNGALTPLAATTAGTWIVWLAPDDATPATVETYICFGDTDADTRIEMVIDDDPSGEIVVICESATVNKWILNTDGAFLSDATFGCIGLVQDGVSPVLYVNGVAPAQEFAVQADKTIWFNDLGGLDNGRLGCRNWGSGGNSSFFNGKQGEVLFYNRALSASEMQNFYNATMWRYK